MYLAQHIPIYLAFWLLVVLFYFLGTGHLRFKKFHFSKRNYYLMMLAFLVATLIDAYSANSWKHLVFFAVFCFTGVIGETMISIWWHLFFGRKFWTYIVDTVYHKYTSLLNFIPWGMGGLLYLTILSKTIPDPYGPAYQNLENIFLFALVFVVLLQVLIFRMLLHRNSGNKFREITFESTFFFYLPILGLIIFLALIYGNEIYLLAIVFGLFAAAIEYLFGQATQFFITKKLWVYNYLAADQGHFTPLTIPLFALGGFYFWSIARILDGLLL
ncbi:MAG: hypothetical protein A3J48_01020 [Candidatus Doudnabacteria bacterium RIFCSPHIGHO2_02_FULL_46_11]|uniref:Uncharacterized protein n=1 Tax=Candidatus Doudnabacteria bacterium RIFCSPHIGHO2_02_FULL_46_11 TaxID=1817832 RepID=A0A1F5P7M3_9BACT|nr:MAG: hypothetical protein A3J48_01020 [Candidatus Doudnabacteria bacterium RIFCSPHIGHO2_02_FULL_46_11]